MRKYLAAGASERVLLESNDEPLIARKNIAYRRGFMQTAAGEGGRAGVAGVGGSYDDCGRRARVCGDHALHEGAVRERKDGHVQGSGVAAVRSG